MTFFHLQHGWTCRTLRLMTEGKRRRGQEDETAGWHHQFSGHNFEQTLGDSEEKGSLSCCSSWGGKQDMIEQLNNNA